MEGLAIVFKAIFSVYMFGGMGILFSRLGILKPELLPAFTKIIIYYIAPCLTLVGIITAWSPTATNLLPLWIASPLQVMVGALISYPFIRMIADGTYANILVCAVAFNNCGDCFLQ